MSGMEPQEIWAKLNIIFNMSARELYESEEWDNLHTVLRRDVYEMSTSEKRESLSRYVRDVMLSEEALTRGDGWRDVLAFLDWVDGGME